MMARIRTVKPEFWSSEQVMSCSPIARLLFIGLWNFCDDGGNHPMSARTIKALVFPGDDISILSTEHLIAELVAADLVATYCIEGKIYLHVQGWKHQKIDKRTFKYPAFIASPDGNSASSRRVLDEESSNGSRGLAPGREGIGSGEDQHNTHSASFENSDEPTTEESSVVHLEPIDPKLPSEMSLDWIPDDKLLKAYAFRTAIPVNAFTDEATASFVCHYSASGRFETQAAWVSLLVKWVKRDTASASNVRQFPMKKQANGPDFNGNGWADDLGDL
ncbi:DnaT-like ssDNA-binding domain-containing protein [Pseudomonas sp. CCI2.4]|uniref:DnaT-like ssDNA-binding domain-containing protein n=1 Tax=Pseudomonas sp. CCI2.4 TaxID=3048617 RepID=UPI002B233A42|nr:DnaT-like ssDNA-binding domain-containing protein [Pseudomonas sp. CCI2.4]MEB0133392.1 DnaT-like ssDNA-binding domain-containing protein [Pseudomonas sp. CCI2.4]